MAEFVLDFLWCVKEIFLVLIQHSPETRPKRNFKCQSVGSLKQKKNLRARDDFFYTKTHTPRVCCETTHTLKHARREREREREATMMLMTAPTTTTTSAPSDDVPPLFLRCF